MGGVVSRAELRPRGYPYPSPGADIRGSRPFAEKLAWSEVSTGINPL